MKISCHCQNITIVAPNAPESLTSCNCSICFRYGSLWGYYDLDKVIIDYNTFPSVAYVWGDKTIEFHHCSQCGCLTHYQSTEHSGKNVLAINFRMAAAEDTTKISVRRFDGAHSWKYLDE